MSSILFTAGVAGGRTRWARPAAVAFIVATLLGGLIDWTGLARAEVSSSISGRVFEDADRDGIDDAGELGWEGIGLWLVPFDGSRIKSTLTATDGSWSFPGLPAGTYRVMVSRGSWDPLELDWVPTTFDDVYPERVVDLGAEALHVPVGVRPIAWSDSQAAPMSEVVASSGLTVRSFTDALSADDILNSLESGSLMGAEAALTSVNFGYRDDASSYCATSIGGAPGTYVGFRAECFVSYQSWLQSRDDALFHEYGHAWANYHDKVVQQDGTYAGYLEARGP